MLNGERPGKEDERKVDHLVVEKRMKPVMEMEMGWGEVVSR